MKPCKKCNNELFYNEGYDSYLCVVCNEWTESQCSDPECCFCVGRPKNPVHEKTHDVIKDIYNDFGIDGVKKALEMLEKEIENE